ncbi:glyoxalase superfamily protein, partial [Klebsiella pneumoniae]|uniref:glyoxalase superfamily protein n=1 Tax=Klebsiella pneumoniae TaxID=573 RepID=UPI00397527DB
MRTFHDAKAMAKSLRQALATKNIEISHSDGLELVAAGFGLGNWNVLAAKIAEDGPA